jgi:hypothetical protein
MPSAVNFGAAGAVIVFCIALGASAEIDRTRLHFAPNGNFASNGDFLPGKFGFNLAEVTSVSELDTLPAGVKGLVWVGRCGGADAAFIKTVRSYAGNPNLFGFYLMDDPDPTGWYSDRCAASDLKAEADWIHANIPEAVTFILLMNMGSSKTPSFTNSYNPTNSHVDLFGISAYPCRTEVNGCDFNMIDRFVAAAASAGIPLANTVPVYQAFGGGDWSDDGGGRYVLPTGEQEQEILARWEVLVPAPAFDYAYSWGSQRGDASLHTAFDLQMVFSGHNRAN